MKRLNRQTEGGLELNLTPLIDMIFILLIFFMVSSSFVRESGVEVDRPVAQTATSKAPSLVIGIDAANVIWMDSQTIDIRSVESAMVRFKNENPDGSVVIAADTMARSGIVIEVLDACRQAGIDAVSVAAKTD